MSTSGAGSTTIGLFPLGQVLFPGMGLPLRVFEPRYREMLRDVSAPGGVRSFGVVGITTGSEVGDPGARFSTVGTIAEITEVRPHPDGTSDLMAVGSRRFRILAPVPGTTYLRARVAYLPEVDGGATPTLCQAVRALHERFRAAAVARTGNASAEPLATDPAVLSYQLASWLPLTPADRQALLEEPTDAARLERVARLLRRELRLLEATGSIAVAPRVVQVPLSAN